MARPRHHLGCVEPDAVLQPRRAVRRVEVRRCCRPAVRWRHEGLVRLRRCDRWRYERPARAPALGAVRRGRRLGARWRSRRHRQRPLCARTERRRRNQHVPDFRPRDRPRQRRRHDCRFPSGTGRRPPRHPARGRPQRRSRGPRRRCGFARLFRPCRRVEPRPGADSRSTRGYCARQPGGQQFLGQSLHGCRGHQLRRQRGQPDATWRLRQ